MRIRVYAVQIEDHIQGLYATEREAINAATKLLVEATFFHTVTHHEDNYTTVLAGKLKKNPGTQDVVVMVRAFSVEQ